MKIGFDIYKKVYRVIDKLCLEVDIENFRKFYCIGILCYMFFFGCCLEEGKEKFDFLLRKFIVFIIRIGCILIFKYYFRSLCLDVEW